MAAWKLTRWKKWREYYPTVLFLIATSLLSSTIMQHHRLWVFAPNGWLQTHVLNDFFHIFITFPATVFIFLSLYPANITLRVGHVLLWICIFSGAEYLTYRMSLMRYDYGWSWGASVVLNCVLFPVLRIHYLNPMLAWIIYFVCLLFVWHVFGFSIEMLK